MVKPKSGSMMNLSMKSNENTLSLRNLKDKSGSFKVSLADRLKGLNKSKKDKMNSDLTVYKFDFFYVSK